MSARPQVVLRFRVNVTEAYVVTDGAGVGAGVGGGVGSGLAAAVFGLNWLVSPAGSVWVTVTRSPAVSGVLKPTVNAPLAGTRVLPRKTLPWPARPLLASPTLD